MIPLLFVALALGPAPPPPKAPPAPPPPKPAVVRLPTGPELARAARSHDEVELERLGRRLGATRLAKLAEAGPREERLAALAALPLSEASWSTLPQVGALAGDGDDEVAAAATRAVRRIAEGLSPRDVWAEEVPPDAPAQGAVKLWKQAQRGELKVPLRVDLVAAAAALDRLARHPPDGKKLGPLLTDPEPSLRRAALEALDPRSTGGELERGLADPDPAVAAAAGGLLCAQVPPAGSRAPAERRAALLAEPARARVRTLIGDAAIGLADRLDLIPCLRAFAAPADRKLLDALARGSDESVKRRARAYGGR